MPVILATIPLAPAIFRFAGHPEEVAALEVVYFQILALGGGGTVMAGAFAAFFTGRGATRVVMVVSISTALLNILLDYLWIFGRLGFPTMGRIYALPKAVSNQIGVRLCRRELNSSHR